MNCPTCKCPNPQGATHCQMCYEVFNRGAAERYFMEQRRLQRQGEKKSDSSAASPSSLSELNPSIKKFRGQTLPKLWEGLRLALRGRKEELSLGGAIVILAVGAVLYNSPLRHLQMFGSALGLRFSKKNAPLHYLVGFQTEAHIWSGLNQEMDTPINDLQINETGSLTLDSSTSHEGDLHDVWIRAQEWVTTQQTGRTLHSQSIPLGHASLTSGKFTLDRQGCLIKRNNNGSPRLGRAMSFLAPPSQKGSHRIGDEWTEPVEWVETINDWKLGWKGQFHWTVQDYRFCGSDTCTQLSYKADVHPHLWGAPVWTRDLLQGIRFAGTTRGEALFDNTKGHLLSNTFSEDGAVTIPILDLHRVPNTQRVGRSRLRKKAPRWIHAEPGDIVLQLKSRTEIQLP